MKKVFSILVVMAFVFAGVAQSGDTQAQPKKNKKVKTPEITFVKLVHDYGQIEQGANGECEFEFKNTGKSNLIIYSSEATCGCTTSTPPKAPIRPGESGEITVTFDSKSQKGKVTKRILVAANTYPTENILTITANVATPQ